MEISDLEIFVEVMNHGSFAAVARERNIDPSSVSRTIADLEKQLGARLFQRTTRKLSPTEAGMNYFTRIAPLLDELRQANQIAGDLSGNPKGELRVTASVSFGVACIVPLLSQFETRYPDLTIDLLLTDLVVDLVSERVDLAVRLGPLVDSSLIARPLMRVTYRVCASPTYLQRNGHPAEPDEVSTHAGLLFPLEGFRSRWIFRDAGSLTREVPVQGRTMISNAFALKECAVRGMGIALLPHWLIDDEIEAGRLVNLFPSYDVTATDFSTAAWLVYPSRTYVPLKVRVFMEYLLEMLGGE